MKLDLHMHTTASDGAWAPSEVVRAAELGGLDVIAITDHDTAGGVAAAQQAAEHVRVIAGAELSSTHDDHELHILGYGIDPSASGIVAHRARAEALRIERMHEMIGRLRDLGVHIGFEDVERHAGPDREMVGRPHLAAALVEAGAVPDFRTAFDRYLSNDGPAYVPTALQTPVEAIETIIQAEGVAVWAHPPSNQLESLLPGLVEAGLAGVEVYRPLNSASWVAQLEQAADHHGLLRTGGSDWHNLERNDALGSWWVEREQIAAFTEVLGIS